MKSNYYKGWFIRYVPIGSQVWVAEKHGVTIRANTKELLRSMIDRRGEDMKKLTQEDIKKYGTEEEKKLLESNQPTTRELLIAIGETQDDYNDGSGGNYFKNAKQIGNQVIMTLQFDTIDMDQAFAVDYFNENLGLENPNFVDVKPGKRADQVIATYNIPKDKLKIHSMSGSAAAAKLKELEIKRRILNQQLKKLEAKKDALNSEILAVRNRAKRK